MLFKQVFLMTVYDESAKQHIMYYVPPMAVAYYIVTNTIPLNGAFISAMSDMLNYDPAKDGKRQRIISTMAARDPVERPELLGWSKSDNNDDITGRLLLFYYDPKESKVSNPKVTRFNS